MLHHASPLPPLAVEVIAEVVKTIIAEAVISRVHNALNIQLNNSLMDHDLPSHCHGILLILCLVAFLDVAQNGVQIVKLANMLSPNVYIGSKALPPTNNLLEPIFLETTIGTLIPVLHTI